MPDVPTIDSHASATITVGAFNDAQRNQRLVRTRGHHAQGAAGLEEAPQAAAAGVGTEAGEVEVGRLECSL